MQAGKPSALTTLIFVLAVLLEAVSCDESQVHWISPSAGDVFGPGDSIVGKWTAQKAVTSPSFKLCSGTPQSSLGSRSDEDAESSGGCGNKVFPTVQEDFGTYSMSLTIPNTTSLQTFYLMMMDDFENEYTSPSFSISPTPLAQTTEQDPEPVVDAGGAQSPLTAPSASSPLVTVTAIPVAEPDSKTSAAPDPSVATRTPLSTAAFAVPLSIVGAILLVACGLALRHSRRLGQERARDIEKLALSRAPSNAESFKSGYSRQSDIEHALSVLSKNDVSYAQPICQASSLPVPLFMPVKMPARGEPRRSTREAYYSSLREGPYQSPSRNCSYAERTARDGPPSYASRPSRRSGYTHSDSSSYTLRPSRVSTRSTHSDSRSCRSFYRTPSPSFPQSRSHSQRSSWSTRSSRPCLPSLRIGSPLDSDPHIRATMGNDYDRERQQQQQRYEDEGEVTHSVLDDYMLSEVEPSSTSALPPPCLLPAPQRLHIRYEGAAVPPMMTDKDVDDFDENEMEEVDLYDAVAKSIRKKS